MSRIKRLCDAEGIEVEYLKVPGGTRVVFHRKDPFVVAEMAEVGRSSIDRAASLSPREKGACAAILERSEASSADVAAELGVSARTARRILAALIEKGAITAHGNTNKRMYAVNSAYFASGNTEGSSRQG